MIEQRRLGAVPPGPYEVAAGRRQARRALVAAALAIAAGVGFAVLPAAERRSLIASAIANRPLLALLALFGSTGVSLLWSRGQAVDDWLFRLLNPRRHHSHALDRSMIVISQLGNFWFAGLLVATTYVLGSRGLAVILGLGSLTLWLAVTILKVLTDRARPFLVLADARVIYGRERGRSFPSGHTAQTFFWATLLVGAFHPPLFAAIGLYLVAALVGATRVYLGVHYPRDVVAGALLAVIWAIVAGLLHPLP